MKSKPKNIIARPITRVVTVCHMDDQPASLVSFFGDQLNLVLPFLLSIHFYKITEEKTTVKLNHKVLNLFHDLLVHHHEVLARVLPHYHSATKAVIYTFR